MNIGAIIQARTSSTRLPGKVLKELPYGSSITVLEQVTRRVKRSSKVDTVIIATTLDREDDEIVAIAEKEGVISFRGSRENVLERYYMAAKENALDTVVRITSDCPCADPEIIDSVISKHIDEDADYTSNTIKKTFPHGLDVEVISFNAMEMAHHKAQKPYDREHVSPYIYKTFPDKFRISVLESQQSMCTPGIRITLDTENDYALLCAIYDYLYENNNFFGVGEVIKLFTEKPWLTMINKSSSTVHTSYPQSQSGIF